MTAYYNENDPKAAAWLRELIKRDLIAPGEVDERSIEDVAPTELAGFNQCHFFAGIGTWSYALRQAGWADTRPVWTGSCPCQPFSAAGKGGGFADERHLWPAFFHLIQHGKRKSVPVLGEQVASKDGLAWLDLVCADMEGEGYTLGALDTCAAGFGAPHIRQRLYWLAHAGRAGHECWLRPDQTHGAHGAPQGEAQQRQRGGADVGSGSVNGGMANAQHAERRSLDVNRKDGCDGENRRRQETHTIAGTCGQVLKLGVAVGERLEGCDGPVDLELQGAPRSIRPTRPTNAVGKLEHADLPGEYGRASSWEQPIRQQRDQQVSSRATGPINGFWGNADWLRCRDGKWRPVEPGTFPLANGIANRVGLLRGYGNGIVAQQAQAFVEAVMEAA